MWPGVLLSFPRVPCARVRPCAAARSAPRGALTGAPLARRPRGVWRHMLRRYITYEAMVGTRSIAESRAGFGHEDAVPNAFRCTTIA